MSYKNMFRHEYECDYLGCTEHFDTSGGLIALCKSKRILAFCSPHAAALRESKVPLVTLSEANDQRRGYKKPTPEEVVQKVANRHEEFVKSLIED